MANLKAFNNRGSLHSTSAPNRLGTPNSPIRLETNGLAKIFNYTTEEWLRLFDYVPASNEIIIFSDYKVKYVDGNKVVLPGMKIGDGQHTVMELSFITDDSEVIDNHIANITAHITEEERNKWNEKVSCSLDGENLTFIKG